MTRRPWRIQEARAPSPRAYLALVRRWWRSWSSWAWGTVDTLEASGRSPGVSDLLIASTRPPDLGGPPPPPTPSSVAAVNTPTAIRAASAERRQLRGAGIPAAVLAQRLPTAPPPATAFAVPLQTVVPIGLGAIERDALLGWAQQGVGYIQRVPQERLGGLAERLVQAAERGQRWETVREELRAELGIGDRHLELIARDQVGKLNGRITEAMQAAAGVTEYTWRAARDERTRDSHRAVDGQRFTWASGGPEGVGPYGQRAHPGQAIQCRCTAEPVVPDELFSP